VKILTVFVLLFFEFVNTTDVIPETFSPPLLKNTSPVAGDMVTDEDRAYGAIETSLHPDTMGQDPTVGAHIEAASWYVVAVRSFTL